MNSAKPIYRLGHTSFSLSHQDSEFERVVSRLFISCAPANSVETEIIDVQMGLSLDVGQCMQQLIARHRDCLFIQAACLNSPDGLTVLLAGEIGSGKTTMTLALALGYGWKVIADDVLLVDTVKERLISLAAPCKLADGVRQQLSCAGVQLPGFILREWYPLSKTHIADDCTAEFDIAVYLDKPDGKPFSLAACTPSEFTRKVLPISNLLQLRGTNTFVNYLPANSCYTTGGGNLKERLSALLELCRKAHSKE